LNTPLDGSALSMHIEALEKLLLDGTTRRSATDLEHLLAEDFVEVGQSGRRYSRAEIVTELANEQPAQLSLSAFTLSPLAETVMLATYVAERRDAAGIAAQKRCAGGFAGICGCDRHPPEPRGFGTRIQGQSARRGSLEGRRRPPHPCRAPAWSQAPPAPACARARTRPPPP